MEVTRVLIVDDHSLFRKGIRGILSAEPSIEVVGEASNGLEACEQAKHLMPDIVLMDINMPECSGVEATKRIKEDFPQMKIVMLTVEEDDHFLFKAIKSGAQGYLLKNLEPEELISHIKGIMRGEAPISKSMASKILLEFANISKTTPREGQGDRKELSFREKEVLRMVAQGATNKEIGAALCISENTVRNHLRNILEKLQLDNRVQAAAYATREGIL
ncbi:MAG: response regulator transcription factor [Clostridia bacterium]|nr:response regulator transcription factor [Clostridia bacterium]